MVHFPPSPQQGCKPTATWFTPFSYILRLISVSEVPPIPLPCRSLSLGVGAAVARATSEGIGAPFCRMIPYLCSWAQEQAPQLLLAVRYGEGTSSSRGWGSVAARAWARAAPTLSLSVLRAEQG